MGTTLEPLPANLAILSDGDLQAAKDSRSALLQQVFHQAGTDGNPDLNRVTVLEGDSASKLRQISAINGDLSRIKELEQQNEPVGYRGQDGELKAMTFPGAPRSVGGRVTPTPGWRAGHWSRAFLNEPALKAATDSLTPSGTVTVPSLTGGIVQIADRPRRILDVVPTIRLAGTDSFSYLRETVRTHAAAPVVSSGTAAATKPTSTYSVVRKDDTVTTIAHISQQIPRNTLADAGLLATYIEGALREGVMLALEDQIINGVGTGAELLGFAADPDISDVPWSIGVLNTARKAITELEDSYNFGGVFVFAPADWETIELLNEADGKFLIGDPGQLPVNRAARQLWGKQVIVSNAVEDGTAYLVDFDGSTLLWERESVRIDWSENTWDDVAGASDFQRNLIRFRGEGRWGFAVTRPAGVVSFPTEA